METGKELFESIMNTCPQKKVVSLCKKLIKKCSFNSLTQELADEVNSMLNKGITYDKERMIKKIKVANKQQTD